MGFALLLSAFCILHSAFSQEDAELPPPPKRPGVQITFLPPPLTGTLSLGIFTKAGKLVRTLHREARTKEFVVGLNGLMTWWDGKNDAGAVAPAGNYRARGYAVGRLETEGVAYHCNDWMTDDEAPHIRRIMPGGHFSGLAGVDLTVELANGKSARLQFRPDLDRPDQTRVFDEAPLISKTPKEIAEEEAGNVEMGLPPKLSWFIEGEEGFAFGDGKLWRRLEERKWEPVKWEGLGNVVAACYGQNSIWVIDDADTGTEVNEYSLDGEVLRHLAIARDEPAPRRIDARGDGELFLYEEDKTRQRVRILWKESAVEKDEKGTAVSIWKTVASKSIVASNTFASVADKLGRDKPVAPDEKINVRLLPNQLMRNASTSVDVGVGVDANGSFLRTADGLPLKRITETPGLKWVAMMREPEGKAVTIFQSDGAVVEEFKARKLANMMAFNAGEYEWAGK